MSLIRPAHARALPLVALVVVLVVPGCATARSPYREAFIRSHAHGWIEVEVEDQRIGWHEHTTESGRVELRRPTCRISVRLNGDAIVSESVRAQGQEAPFDVSTGFRLVAPTGLARLGLSYSGCRPTTADEAKVPLTLEIHVRDGHVSEVAFDGEVAHVVRTRSDETVTLEQVDVRLERIEERLGE